jgi:MFS family permease
MRATSWRASVAVPAVVLTWFLLASSAPTPLYPLVQVELGLTSSTLTLIYAAYPIGLLCALLVVGPWASQEMKAGAVSAIVLEIVALLLLLTGAAGWVLIAARALQGIATGLATSSLASWLQLRAPRLGPAFNTLAPMAGIGGGALLAGLAAATLSAAPGWIYGVLVAGLAAALVVVPVAQTAPTRVAGPPASRVAAPVPGVRERWGLLVLLASVWALVGLLLSLGPGLIATLGWTTPFAGGVLVAVMASGGGLAVAVVLRAERETTRVWTAALGTGAAMIFVSVVTGHAVVLMAGAAVAGLGVGGGFHSALQHLLAGTTDPTAVGRRLTRIYVVSYAANSVPAIGAGVLADQAGIAATSAAYALAVAAACAVASVLMTGPTRPRRSAGR